MQRARNVAPVALQSALARRLRSRAAAGSRRTLAAEREPPMTQERRLVLTLSICLAIYLGWGLVMVRTHPHVPPAAPVAQEIAPPVAPAPLEKHSVPVPSSP